MAERVNAPPLIRFPQSNPYPRGTIEHKFVQELINANRQQQIVIEQLWRRTGGASDAISETSVRESYAYDTASDDTEAERAVTPAVIPEAVAVVDVAPKWNEVAASAKSYTALGWDYILASKKAVILFPLYPDTDEEIRTKNTDGTRIKLDGNGRLLNGARVGYIKRKGASIDWRYRVDTNSWEAI